MAGLRLVGAEADGPVSAGFYDAHRRSGDLRSSRLIQVHGSWAEACAAAGVECHRPPRTTYAKAWSEEDLLAWVVAFLGDGGGSYATLRAWLQDRRGEGAPSAQTVRNRLGPWAEVRALAAERRGTGT